MAVEPGSGLNRRAFLRGSLAVVGGIASAGVVAACSGSDDKSGATTTSASAQPSRSDVALQAFFAGVPLLTTVRTLQTFAPLLGVNRLFVTNGLVDPKSHFVVAPNRDTVYALAVLDLRAGPQVLTLPAIPDRYHVLQFIDAWMGNFALLGTRVSGGRAGSWVIVGPDDDRAVPAGHQRLRAPTPQAMLLGRVRAVDDTDAQDAARASRTITLAPLDAGAPPAPPMAKAPGTPQSVGADGARFFDELGDALAVNPPTQSDQRAAITAARPLGVGAGRHPARGASSGLLGRAVQQGLDDLGDRELAGGRRVNGWDVNLTVGQPDTLYDLRSRAVVARYFWGPVPAAEAVYPTAAVASDGKPLDGGKRYRIRFPKGGQPPVDAFWSVTAYGDDMFLVPNAIGHYSIGGDTPGLALNEDGSLDVYLQHDAPPGRESNWIPVPRGPFHVIMRCYLPRAGILDGSYHYPPITVLGD